MLLYSGNGNGLNIYRLDKIEQYNAALHGMYNLVAISARYNSLVPDDLLKLIETNLFRKNDNFGLWTGVNKNRNNFILFATSFIINDDDGNKAALIKDLSLDMKYCKFLIRTFPHYINEWAKQRGAVRILMHSKHDAYKIERLLQYTNPVAKFKRAIFESEVI